MADWYEFLDPRFAPPKEAISTRDRVVTICTNCGASSTVLVSNLKVQIRRIGMHLCWGCACRKGWIERKKKMS